MSINAVWLAAALLGGCEPPTPAAEGETVLFQETSMRPQEDIASALSRWGSLEWKEGSNKQGPTVLLMPEVHFDPGDAGKENGAVGTLHRQLFEAEKALIKTGATHLRHEASLIQALATYLKPPEITASEFVRALRTSPVHQKEFRQITGSPMQKPMAKF